MVKQDMRISKGCPQSLPGLVHVLACSGQVLECSACKDVRLIRLGYSMVLGSLKEPVSEDEEILRVKPGISRELPGTALDCPVSVDASPDQLHEWSQ